MPFSHSSAHWLFSPSCIFKIKKNHNHRACQATLSTFAQQCYVTKYSKHILFCLPDFFFSKVWHFVLCCHPHCCFLACFVLGSCRQGLLVVPWGRGEWRGSARGPSLCQPCASPTRLVLQGCRRGGGGPILWAAGGCQAVHPDRLPGVDHPERGKLNPLSTSPPPPCSLL